MEPAVGRREHALLYEQTELIYTAPQWSRPSDGGSTALKIRAV